MKQVKHYRIFSFGMGGESDDDHWLCMRPPDGLDAREYGRKCAEFHYLGFNEIQCGSAL